MTECARAGLKISSFQQRQPEPTWTEELQLPASLLHGGAASVWSWFCPHSLQGRKTGKGSKNRIEHRSHYHHLLPPLHVLLPWFNNLPAGRSTSYRHAPFPLALALASAPPNPHFSCPSHGDNGNARLRFLTTGSGSISIAVNRKMRGASQWRARLHPPV